jgi:hypothetical protein
VRQLRFALLIVAVGASSLPVLAHDDGVCLPMDDFDYLVCRHHFEGVSINLPVREVLESLGAACEHVVVNVLQRQGRMLAELGEPQELDAEQCSTTTSFTLDLPDVRSEVDILVQFSSPESAHAPEFIAVRVYPDTLLDPLTKFAEQHSLVVFDEEGVLTDFLDRNEIEYGLGFDAMSDKPIALLVQPDKLERLLEDRNFDSAVIFQEKVIDLPQVRAVSMNGQTRVYVETPLLRDLLTNPLAQKALLDVIRLATNPLSTDRG